MTVAGHAIADPAPTRAARVVVLGDSISAGYGLSPDEAYPALLGELARKAGLDVEVVNAGVGGDTSAGGLRRVEWALTWKADVLVIALGGNDGLRGLRPADMEKNLQGIVDKAKAKWPEIRIVLAGMQMPGNMGPGYTRDFSAVFPRVAEANKAALVPFLLDGVGGDPRLNQPDRIHPTAEGQEIIARTVWEVLEPVLRGAGDASRGR